MNKIQMKTGDKEKSMKKKKKRKRKREVLLKLFEINLNKILTWINFDP
jgi:hypothetical protein